MKISPLHCVSVERTKKNSPVGEFFCHPINETIISFSQIFSVKQWCYSHALIKQNRLPQKIVKHQ